MRSVLAAVLVLAGAANVSVARAAEDGGRMYLHKDWQLQSSCEAKASGAEISAAGFDAKSWHHSDMPSTVVAALVADKTFPEPTYGTNLRKFPGFSDDRQHFFSNLEMPKDSPFRCSWWVRTDFDVPADRIGKTNWLNFLGINYG